MKKFLLIFGLMLSFALTSFAQTYQYKANNFAIASVNNGYYTWQYINGSQWHSCEIYITFNMDNDRITIYSQEVQIYKVIDSGSQYTDKDGGSNLRFRVVDQDGDYGHVRLRKQADGTSQIYVDFADVAWCYGNVVRIN